MVMQFSLSLSYTFQKKNSTKRFIKFHFKVCNNQTFTSQFINSFLTIPDNFIVMSAAEIKACQNTESITTCFYELYTVYFVFTGTQSTLITLKSNF